METYTFQILISLFVCLAEWTFGEECDALSSISTEYLGMRMKTYNTMLWINTPTSSECARQCKLFGFCRSFNFGEATNECELNNKDSSDSPGEIDEDADFDYFDIDAWPEEIAEECAGHSCLADEMCAPAPAPNRSAVCVKADEFMDLKKDECSPNPCTNGGVCTDGINRYTCSCASGWRGQDCDIDVNECRSSPCQYGSTCNNERDDFSCSCPVGWTGKRCDTEL